MLRGLHLPARRVRFAVEAAVRAGVARDRLVEVVRPPGGQALRRELSVPGLAREVTVENSGNEHVAEHRLERRPADVALAPRMQRRVDDLPRGELGLEHLAD